MWAYHGGAVELGQQERQRMTLNLLTIPLIFVIAGVGLLIVAIIGELSIKEIRVPPLPAKGRILAAVAGIVFIGLGSSWAKGRDTTASQVSGSSVEGVGEKKPPIIIREEAEALINSPADGATVPLKIFAAGTVRNALTAPTSYWLLLQDDDGDYYSPRRIAVQQNGAWAEPITFGPKWNGRTAQIVVVQTTLEDPLNGASGVHTLPAGLRTMTKRSLRVQTP